MLHVSAKLSAPQARAQLLSVASFLLGFLISVYSFAGEELDPSYDRLDGKGPSGKRVDVIEWEGNLEVHVYPAGSLKGLGLKLDKQTGKRVMVLAYRFEDAPGKELIRRAILGINLKEGFKAFKDPNTDDYDKIVISNNTLANPLVAFGLDPAPKQLYPDGHGALAQSDAKDRQPAAHRGARAVEEPASEIPEIDKESGAISPFFMRDRNMGR